MGEFFGVLPKRFSRPEISVTSRARARDWSLFLRSSREAEPMSSFGLPGFVCWSRFFSSAGGGAVLKFTCGALPCFETSNCAGPVPPHTLSASFDFSAMHTPPGVGASAARATAPVSPRTKLAAVNSVRKETKRFIRVTSRTSR